MAEITRRGLLAGTAALGGAVALGARGATAAEHDHGAHGATEAAEAAVPHTAGHDGHAGFTGTVDHAFNGFHPQEILRDFDHGKTSRLPNGRTLREWELVAFDREIELAPGIRFPGWSYNGRIPGPTLRAREGDRMRITFVNGSAHPHTIHFHGIHPADMDGVAGSGDGTIPPGGRTVYEFDAEPYGLHLYHCHVRPLAEHIAKGMYGAVVIDPKKGREDADELVMVMNGFDTNFDRVNEIYAVNTIGFTHMDDPVRVKRDELVRIYLVNVLEYDLLNSFHLHGNFFRYIPTGTALEGAELTDTIMQCQGQRGILEMRFPHAGRFMFHAHQSEFAELGWQGFFEVAD
jgi:FtsP/CotA-like multicopper oxidase with cupredoxin domain